MFFVAGVGRFQDGVTLIELLVSLCLLSILGSVAVPVAQMHVKRESEKELRSALREIRTAIDAYRKEVLTGRIGRDVGSSGYPRNLDVLVNGIVDQRDLARRKIYFLRRIPVDPFSKVEDPADSNNWGLRSYASEYDEPEEGDDVYDIYSKSSGVGLNGVPYSKW